MPRHRSAPINVYKFPRLLNITILDSKHFLSRWCPSPPRGTYTSYLTSLAHHCPTQAVVHHQLLSNMTIHIALPSCGDDNRSHRRASPSHLKEITNRFHRPVVPSLTPSFLFASLLAPLPGPLPCMHHCLFNAAMRNRLNRKQCRNADRDLNTLQP